jgi:SAM-dependent methyltransferase
MSAEAATAGAAHWRNAWAYDVENAGMVADLPYWTDVVARRRPTRVLELACGTGRIALALATAGLALDPAFRVVGLDSSPAMIARAQEKLAGEAPAVASAVVFLEADMRNFALEERFDLVICGFNAFAYLEKIDDQLACLAAVRHHLAPGGCFGLDLVVPHLAYLEEARSPVPPVRIEVDASRPAPGVARARRTYSDRYDGAAQAIRTTYAHEVYYEDGRQERWVDDLNWHMTFPRELELLLRLAGLAAIERYGGYDLAPFDALSTQYLWLIGDAERTTAW